MRILSESRRSVSSFIVFALLFALIPPLASPEVALGVPTTNAGTVTARLNTIVFPTQLPAGTGFAGGVSGVILKTTDHGLSWTRVRSGGTYDIRSIGFFAPDRGWAVTLNGETLRTSDGGETWGASPESTGLTGGSYASPQIHEVAILPVGNQPMMFAAGGAQGTPPAVWRGNYDGTNQRMYWADRADALLGWYDPPQTQDPYPRDGLGYFYDIESRPSRYMWAVGQDVFKTPFKSVAWRYDANATGQKWAAQTSIPGAGKLLGVSFASDSYGVTVGEGGMVSYTTNGGVTWTAGSSGETTVLSAVAAGSSGRAIAVGASGRILRSIDSGATWTRMASPTARYLEDVAWIPGTDRLVAVGDNGEVVYSLDGGVIWQRPATPPPPAPVMTSLSSASHPAGEWKSALPVSATWAATGAQPLTYHWVIDQNPGTVPTTANPSTTSTSLPVGTNLPGSGTHYLHVVAKDTYNQSSAPLHIQLLADVTAPAVFDDALPEGESYTGSGIVTINATDEHAGVERIEYRIDGDVTVQTVYAAQHAVSFPDVGSFTLEYRVFDDAGNASPTPTTWVSRDVSVVAPPGPVMTSLSSASHPAGVWTNTLAVSANWAATGAGTLTYHWVIDQTPGTVPTAANPSMTSTSLPVDTDLDGSGTHYLHVRAIDDFSTWSSPLHIQLLADVTKPSVVDDVLAGGYLESATVKVTATDSHSGVQKIEYRINAGATQTHAGAQATIEFPVPGDYTLEYRAYDNAGNVQPGAGDWISRQVTVNAPPAPVITDLRSDSHPAGEWKSSTTVRAEWEAAGATALTYYWKIDKNADTVPTLGDVSTAELDLSTSVTGGSGTYYLHVVARDTYGTWSLPWHQQILVDTVVPSTADDLIGTSFTGAVDVVVTATDAHSGVERIEYRLNGGSEVRVASDQAVITLYPGITKLEHRAFDAAGQSSTWKAKNFTITTKQTPVQGDNRYATAIAASKQIYPGKMPAGPDGNRTVVIASGANWPDALGASGLAGAHRGPLLLTDPTTLPSAVDKQIRDLGANRAIIVGGTGAVSTRVQEWVEAAVGGRNNVTRIGGANRYATSDAIGAKVVSVPGRDAWDGTAFVATGENFPDALAAAPLAAAKGYPLYLAPRAGISPSTLNAMKAAGVKQVVLLGGTSVVTTTTQSRITGAGITVSGRWSGADRYSTARDVATKSLARGLTTRNVALATGENFPDALAGGVMQGLTGSIMVLTTSTTLHAQAEGLLSANAAFVGEVRFIGGQAALSSAVRSRTMAVVGP